jgi:hypothetical protein
VSLRRGLSRAVVAASLVALPFGSRASAQQATPPESTHTRVPFGVGELLEYDIRFSGKPTLGRELHVGNGSMEVLPMDTVRGHDTWHTMFRLSGGIPFYRVNDKYEAWADAQSLMSLRFFQDIDEGSYEPKRHYEIFPDRREFVENDKPPQESVDHPVDDGFLLYYLRTVPLRVGLDTTINNYFKADRNPIRIKVVRREKIKVPAGEFNAIVIEPTIKTTGIFKEGGQANIWLSDDDNRIMLQLKSKVNFGSLNVYLKSYRPSPTTNVPLNRVPPNDAKR